MLIPNLRSMTFRETLPLALALALSASALCAPGAPTQSPDASVAPRPTSPTVTFNFEFAGAVPSYYVIVIESNGHAAYHSDAPEQEIAQYRTPSGRPTGEPYRLSFTVSPGTREKVFTLAEKLNYFQGDYDYKKNKIANTGSKTLIYADPQRHSQTTYNWSQDERIAELTKLFQSLSTTLEFGRRLEHEYRYTKLALDAELKSMEQAAHDGNLAEVEAVTPILTKISKDTAVMHVARLRAQRLLDKLSTQAPTATQ
jgi:hypothetical protein